MHATVRLFLVLRFGGDIRVTWIKLLCRTGIIPSLVNHDTDVLRLFPQLQEVHGDFVLLLSEDVQTAHAPPVFSF